MYSWKTIRTVCAVLLLLPIIHLVYLVSQDMLATLDPSPEIWEDEVSAYVASDQSSSLPENPVVVIGGRGVKLWPGLEDLLSPRPVLMRGLGDATVDDITHYHAQLIGFYRPQAVVLLPGASEFHLRDNKSAQELADAIRKLVELDLTYGVSREFYIFTPIKTPLYSGDHARIDELSRLLQRWADGKPHIAILDANALLSLVSGKPNPDFFRMDGLHLNEHGYLRLSLLLKERLERDAREYYTLDTPR